VDGSFTHSDKAAWGVRLSLSKFISLAFFLHTPAFPLPSVGPFIPHSRSHLSVESLACSFSLIGISPGASSAMSVECEIWDA